MEKIDLTSEYLNKMPLIGVGGNSQVKMLNFNELAKIYGVYDEEFYSDESDEKKVEYIFSKTPIEFTTFPKKKIYVNNIFAGFSMDFIRPSTQLIYTKENISIQKRVEILVKIKNIILEMIKQGLYMVDINELNVLLQNFQPYIIDIDGTDLESDSYKFVLEYFYQLCMCYLYDNLDFGELDDYYNVEPLIKQTKKRDKLNKHLQQTKDDIEEIEKVRELILKYDKPYLNATF